MLLTACSDGCAGARATSPPPRGPTSSQASPSAPREPAPAVVATYSGRASWYGRPHHGRPTASGERFDMNALTAAHRKLPFGTHVRVTNLRNARSVVVRINDRGPYGPGRIIDVSFAAAQALGMITAGVVPVRVEVLAAAR